MNKPFSEVKEMTLEVPANSGLSGSVSLQVQDNSGGEARVLDLNEPWRVRVRIEWEDQFNLLVNTSFEAHLFVESMGPGPEVHLGSGTVTVTGTGVYNVDINVGPNQPQFNGPPAISSLYKVVTVVEHKNNANAETIIAGFAEAPAIHLRNP
jgi:hypothetical protein